LSTKAISASRSRADRSVAFIKTNVSVTLNQGKRGANQLPLDFMDPLRRPGADGAVRACSGVPSTSPVERQGGESWFVSGLHYTNYNHCATPNASAKDCTLDWLEADFHNRTLRSGVFAARSRHPGGVNVLSMDGAVRFAGDSIDKATWRALATRSGGEVASSAF